jgi:hypothetical protein
LLFFKRAAESSFLTEAGKRDSAMFDPQVDSQV